MENPFRCRKLILKCTNSAPSMTTSVLCCSWQVPKIVVVGPKLIFSFTVAQRLISFLEHSWNPSTKSITAKKLNRQQ